MKTTLDAMIKALTLTRLEIERFKAKKIGPQDAEVPTESDNFLQQITNTLLDLQEKVTYLQKEIER